jgi:hypothetical protein
VISADLLPDAAVGCGPERIAFAGVYGIVVAEWGGRGLAGVFFGQGLFCILLDCYLVDIMVGGIGDLMGDRHLQCLIFAVVGEADLGWSVSRSREQYGQQHQDGEHHSGAEEMREASELMVFFLVQHAENTSRTMEIVIVIVTGSYKKFGRIDLTNGEIVMA